MTTPKSLAPFLAEGSMLTTGWLILFCMAIGGYLAIRVVAWVIEWTAWAGWKPVEWIMRRGK